MRRVDLERALKDLGYSFLRHGSNHDVWSNGVRSEAVGRHAEIGEKLARKIIRRCGGAK